MKKPLLLDLFCGAGGAARGYQRAGFCVVGVDIVPQPRYAGDLFICMDALEFARKWGHGVDAIHASPPCQVHAPGLSAMNRNNPNYARHVDFIPQTRELLEMLGKPYVIENVVGAPLKTVIVLCGKMFNLRVYRHRLFESNILLFAPSHIPHRDNMPTVGRGVSPKGFITVTGNFGSGGNRPDGFDTITDYARHAMGIDWMSKKELTQAIPPAYTEYIGKQLIKAV